MEATATKTTKPLINTIEVTKGERLELQKKLYNYIVTKWNKSNQDNIPLNRAEISQAIGCEVHRVSNIIYSLIDKNIIEMDRLKRRGIDIYHVFKIKTAPNYDLTMKQQDILIYLNMRKGSYRVDALAVKVAMEYYDLVKEVKDLKEKNLINMWHSQEKDGYFYNVENSQKGEEEVVLMEFLISAKDRETRAKEKKKRKDKMCYNQAIKKRIEQAKQKEKDLANYGACVEVGERRRLGDASLDAIKNYNTLCNECADKILLEAFKKTFIQALIDAKSEIDRGKLYHTQKFKFRFYGIIDRLVAISLAKSYTYDFASNEIKEVVIIDKINCNLINKKTKLRMEINNEN